MQKKKNPNHFPRVVPWWHCTVLITVCKNKLYIHTVYIYIADIYHWLFNLLQVLPVYSADSSALNKTCIKCIQMWIEASSLDKLFCIFLSAAIVPIPMSALYKCRYKSVHCNISVKAASWKKVAKWHGTLCNICPCVFSLFWDPTHRCIPVKMCLWWVFWHI